MWKYVPTVIAILIVPFVWLVPKIMPVPNNVGVVVGVGGRSESPLPHYNLTLETNEGPKEVFAYAGGREYKLGNRITFSSDGVTLIAQDIYRVPYLASLALLFIVVVLLVSGMHGMRSLLGLVFSFIVIFKFVLPQIVAGSNPILIALLASMLILTVAYFLSHGINSKSVIAIIGTLGALCVTGILAVIYGQLVGLSGMGAEETGFLLETLPRDSFYKLLLAGIIIGSLGVLDDITISQASIVMELKKTNHRLKMGDLFVSAMRIGHDHIASLVNTLVLVYAGSALPLLLLFVVSQLGYSELINYEALAEEVVRTLVASIGLITAVPITTLIASYWYDNK